MKRTDGAKKLLEGRQLGNQIPDSPWLLVGAMPKLPRKELEGQTSHLGLLRNLATHPAREMDKSVEWGTPGNSHAHFRNFK